jgi:O-antigen ligase
MTMPTNLLTRTGLLLSIFLGIALQIQASIGIQTDYSGLRVNLGDLALPFAGLFVLVTLAFKKSEMQRWDIPFGIFWPILLTAVMTFALFNGRAELGEWSHWALLNKYAGWLVLMAYLGLGAWLVTNTGNPSVKVFLQTFIIFFLLTALIGLITMIAKDIFPAVLPPMERQLRGMMGNRNAYAFVMLIVLPLLAIYKQADIKILKAWVFSCFWFFLPFFLVYNGSRIATGAAFIFLFIILVWFGKKALRLTLFPFFLGMLLIIGMYSVNEKLVFREHQNIYTGHILEAAKANYFNDENAENAMTYAGDQIRLRVLGDSLELWKKNSVTGSGLGTFLHYQKEKYSDSANPVLDIIDSTPLWLLTETGIMGLAAFLAFYGLIFWTCWKNRKQVADDLGVLRVSLLLILTGFAIMSLFHELLYARHLWFMLGMALALPKKHPA